MESLFIYLMKQIYDILPFPFGYDRVEHLQIQDITAFKVHLCLFKHTCRQHAVLLQLLHNTFPVFHHKRTRRVLLGQRILLFQADGHPRIAKKLLFNLLFHLPYMLFLDQMRAENMDTEKITF